MHIPRKTFAAFTLVEVAAASAVLAATFAAAVPMVLLVQSERQAIEARRQALAAADILLERVLALGWDALDAPLSDEAIQAREVLESVPGGAWKLSVAADADAVPSKRVTVTVSFRSRGRAGSARLTAWAFNDTGKLSR